MNILWVNILGLSLIALIVWWFWLPQQKSQEKKNDENEMSHH